MESKISEYLRDSFAKLVNDYGFRKADTSDSPQPYLYEYVSNVFLIRIENYRREFYASFYKLGSTNGINVFNLLSFLNPDSSNVPEPKYFEEEKNLDECYKKQLNYIANTIYENYATIHRFFENGDYELKIIEIRAFMLKKLNWPIKKD